MIERGNHKSALSNASELQKNIMNDVARGFSLPLVLSDAVHLPNAAIAPLGIAQQDGYDEHGNKKSKFRLTHDQSFKGPSGTSLNSRTNMDKLPKCMFGHALSRMLHYIIALRGRHPSTPILLGKYDLASAYRRAHLSPQISTESLTVHDGILLMALRMTFGGSAYPSLWSCISECMCDLANDIIQCRTWDHQSLHSPIQHLIPPAKRLPQNTPFAQAKELAMEYPINDIGIVDVYTDDMPPICLDSGDNAERCAAAVPLAVHIMNRPVQAGEPLPRDDVLSLTQLSQEGAMEEVKQSSAG